MSPEKRAELIAAAERCTDEEINALTRCCIRLLNDDPKIDRLLKALHAGQIDRKQFLRLV